MLRTPLLRVVDRRCGDRGGIVGSVVAPCRGSAAFSSSAMTGMGMGVEEWTERRLLGATILLYGTFSFSFYAALVVPV